MESCAIAGIDFSHLSPYCIALQDHPAGPSLRMILQDYPAGPSGGLCGPLIILLPGQPPSEGEAAECVEAGGGEGLLH